MVATTHPKPVQGKLTTTRRPLWHLLAIIATASIAFFGGIIALNEYYAHRVDSQTQRLDEVNKHFEQIQEKASNENKKADFERKVAEKESNADLRQKYRAWLAQQAPTCIQLSDLIILPRDYQRHQVVVEVGGKPRFEGWATGRQQQLEGFSLYDLAQADNAPMAFGFIDLNEITDDKRMVYTLLTRNVKEGKRSLVLLTVGWALKEETGYRNLIIYSLTLPPP